MEYQKITNILDNIPNQPSKFRALDPRGTYKTNSQIKFKTSAKLKSSFCDYSDEYILAKGTRLVATTLVAEIIFKNCSVYW